MRSDSVPFMVNLFLFYYGNKCLLGTKKTIYLRHFFGEALLFIDD